MTACFRRSSGLIHNASDIDVPCPTEGDAFGHTPCCFHGDICLSGGICHYSTDSFNGGSGYYMQDCTDESYQDGTVCPQYCTDQVFADVVYSYQDKLWYCCGADTSGKVTCNNPTNESFNAPPPGQLVVLNSTNLTTSASPSLAPTASVTTTSTALSIMTSSTESQTASPISTNASKSPGFSSGTGVGIGIGVIAILLLLLAGFFFVRLKRKKPKAPVGPEDGTPVYLTSQVELSSPSSYRSKHTTVSFDSPDRSAEMPAYTTRSRAELEGRPGRIELG